MRSKTPRQQKRPHGEGAKGSQWRNALGRGWALVTLFTGLLATVIGWRLGILSVGTVLEVPLGFFQPIDKDSHWEEQRKEVKDTFVASWDAYAKHAWGKLFFILSYFLIFFSFLFFVFF